MMDRLLNITGCVYLHRSQQQQQQKRYEYCDEMHLMLLMQKNLIFKTRIKYEF
jgi:hypothetical protein